MGPNFGGVMFKVLFALCFLFPSLVSAKCVLISDRKDFYDADCFAEQQVKKLIDFNKPEELSDLSESEWISRIRGKRVAILVHGYNSDYDLAIKCYSLITAKSKGVYDAVVCYLWPGGDDVWEYYKATAQIKSGTLVSRFMNVLKDLSDHATQVDVLAHSMGCRLALQTLTLQTPLRIQNLFLIAPAVDDNSIEMGDVYAAAVRQCGNIYVFYSYNDRTLRWGYPLVEWDRSLGAWGAENPEKLAPNVQLVNATDHIYSHKQYLTADFVYDFVRSKLGVVDVFQGTKLAHD